MPLAQLLGDPDGVLLGVEDVERVGRRINPLAAGEIVLGEEPHADRLRLDPQRLRRERSASSSDSLSLPPAARMLFALGESRRRRLLDALPVDADLLDAEIVLGPDLETEHLGIEDDLLPRQILAGSDGGSSSRAVIDTVNGSLPARPNSSCQPNLILREPSIVTAAVATAAA